MRSARHLWISLLFACLAFGRRPCAGQAQAEPPADAQVPASRQPSGARETTAVPGMSSCPPANGLPEDRTYPIRKSAFDALAAHRNDEARHLMRCAIRANPADQMAIRQEVYLDLNAGDPTAASEDIDALRAQNASSAQFEAQQGYILAKQKHYDDARSAFSRAIAYGDPAITASALKAIGVLDAEDPPRWMALALDSQYLHRFNDGLVDTSARFYQRLGKRSPVSAYLNARLLRDTASGVGLLPQIFSDNAFLGGVGLAFQPDGAHYSVSTEANAAYVFFKNPANGNRASTAATVPDFRAVGAYYQVFRPRESRFALEANGSFGYYSRYQHDAIAYLQPRETFNLATGDVVRASVFFQQSLALDTNRLFYNNTLELIPGFELSLTEHPALALRTQYVRGFYLPAGANSGNPYGSSYNDFRLRLTYQKTFNFTGRGTAR